MKSAGKTKNEIILNRFLFCGGKSSKNIFYTSQVILKL